MMTQVAAPPLATTTVESWLRPFVVSRLIVFGVWALTSMAAVIPGDPIALAMRPPDVGILTRGDAAHYLAIAQQGYATTSTAFFPLYPLLLALMPSPIWGVLLSTLCFGVGLYVTGRLAHTYGFDAERTMWWVALFPGSHFFSAVMPEALFLMLASGSMLAARREYWVTAGVCAALASATRVQGILLWPALLLESRRMRLSLLLLPPLGLLTFMAYLGATTGNPLAFISGHEDFGHDGGWPVVSWLQHPAVFHTWAFYPLYFACTVIWAGATGWLIHRRLWPLACFALLALIVSLSGFPFAPNRHILLVFPVFLVLGEVLRDGAWRTASAAAMTVLSLLFAGGFGLALN